MALLIATAMICALASCGSNADQTQHQPEAETETEDDTLKSLRKTIADSGCQMGVAFLGTMDEGDTDVLQWLKDSGAVEQFPFLADISGNEVVTQPGNEMYCIVPADKEDTVTVRTYDTLSSAAPVGQVFCTRAPRVRLSAFVETPATSCRIWRSRYPVRMEKPSTSPLSASRTER